MANGVGPLGHSPIPPHAFFPVRGPKSESTHSSDPRIAAAERSGTPAGFVVDAGRVIDRFAESAELTSQQAERFDAASEGLLRAVAMIRSERLGSLRTAQRTQLALEDFALEIDQLQPQGGSAAASLTALVNELQLAFDVAFDEPVGQEEAPQIFFPRMDGRGTAPQRLLSAYRSEASGRGLPPDSSIDTKA